MTHPNAPSESRDGPPEDSTPLWHTLTPGEVEGELHTSHHGLSAAEVDARLAHHGPNQLEEESPPSAVAVLLRQFRSPLIYILVAATAVTLLLAEYIDAAVIAVVLALNAIIGFTQERKAEGAVRALMQLVVPHARVIRDGHEIEIDSRDVVPGDVVLLEPGSRVPADLRLVSVNALQVDESLLTGESVPVTKRQDPVDRNAVLADRTCMTYTGSIVASGRARGVVVATGSATELGAIANLIRGEAITETPLQRRMASFATIIGVVVGVASVVVFASGMALGRSANDMFLTAVALAVAAIPEGLPVVFTITLALGVRRMARRNAIIRRLPAVETLGSTTVIGSDKTGTLTQNRMTVQAVWTAGSPNEHGQVGPSGEQGEGRWYQIADGDDAELMIDDEPALLDDHPALHETLLTGVLTNEADAYHVDGRLEASGDPTEVALIGSAAAAGIPATAARESNRLVAEIPFEPEQRYSAAVRERHGHQEMFVKGAPERVVEMCDEMLTDDGARPVEPDAIIAAAHALAGRGLRVLAMASRRLPDRIEQSDQITEPRGLVFLGLQGMIDPPRQGVREAIDACHDAGIRVRMITGDHVATATAIADDLGITHDGDAALNGNDLAAMDDDELGERVDDVAVYARVAPEDKLRIVRSLQDKGEIVAVTGDGVNDAPALKAAAIGIAMGQSGTDVAREASDMVLADDNFASIAAAVEEGRVTFDNVRKVTFFLVSTGAATILAILVSVWLQWPLLMVPAQLLWLNLVTNGLQDVALAFEPGEKGVVKRPPRRPGEGVLSRLLWERTVVAGAVMAAGALVLFRWELNNGASLEQAQTVALTTMVIFMAFHAGNSRSELQSLFEMNPLGNPFLLCATTGAVALHVAAIYLPPTQFVLRVEPFEPERWLVLVPIALTIVVAIELHKWVCRRMVRR